MGFMLPRKVTQGLKFKTFTPASSAHQTSSWTAHKMSASQARAAASSAKMDSSVKVGDVSGFQKARNKADFNKRIGTSKTLTTADIETLPSSVHQHWYSTFTPEERTSPVIGQQHQTPVDKSWASIPDKLKNSANVSRDAMRLKSKGY